MSKGSEAVKQWRQRTKQRMVDAFGGKCCCCGYSKCIDALEFHHLDPVEKDFGFGAKRASPVSWSRIVSEIKKCVMVCANCHREVHAHVLQIPADAARFDETFEVYREGPKKGTCPVCQSAMPIVNKTCSLSCAASTTGKVDWSKWDLIELKKTMNHSQIGRLIGVSDVSVLKRWRKISS